MTERRTYHDTLVAYAEGWPSAMSGLTADQVYAIEQLGDNLCGTIDGTISAEFVDGICHGVALVESVSRLEAMDEPSGQSTTTALLVGMNIAHRILSGEIAP